MEDSETRPAKKGFIKNLQPDGTPIVSTPLEVSSPPPPPPVSVPPPKESEDSKPADLKE